MPSQKAYRPLFAKGYNDLILRSYDELPTWQNYLRDNPRRLLMKQARPEWLRPFFGLKVGTTTYSSLGNQALLRSPRRIAVRVSRRLDSNQEHHNEKRTITAYQCQQLNLMAIEICNNTIKEEEL